MLLILSKPLTVFGVQGLCYIPFLIISSLICLLNSVSLYIRTCIFLILFISEGVVGAVALEARGDNAPIIYIVELAIATIAFIKLRWPK